MCINFWLLQPLSNYTSPKCIFSEQNYTEVLGTSVYFWSDFVVLKRAAQQNICFENICARKIHNTANPRQTLNDQKETGILTTTFWPSNYTEIAPTTVYFLKGFSKPSWLWLRDAAAVNTHVQGTSCILNNGWLLHSLSTTAREPTWFNKS